MNYQTLVKTLCVDNSVLVIWDGKLKMVVRIIGLK